MEIVGSNIRWMAMKHHKLVSILVKSTESDKQDDSCNSNRRPLKLSTVQHSFTAYLLKLSLPEYDDQG